MPQFRPKPARTGAQDRLWRARRAKILAPNPLYCGICGAQIDKSIPWPADGFASVDHIVPRSKGGTDALENLQPAHLGCNKRKMTKAPTAMPPKRSGSLRRSQD